jgi:hypothetical protein
LNLGRGPCPCTFMFLILANCNRPPRPARAIGDEYRTPCTAWNPSYLPRTIEAHKIPSQSTSGVPPSLSLSLQKRNQRTSSPCQATKIPDASASAAAPLALSTRPKRARYVPMRHATLLIVLVCVCVVAFPCRPASQPLRRIGPCGPFRFLFSRKPRKYSQKSHSLPLPLAIPPPTCRAVPGNDPCPVPGLLVHHVLLGSAGGKASGQQRRRWRWCPHAALDTYDGRRRRHSRCHDDEKGDDERSDVEQ